MKRNVSVVRFKFRCNILICGKIIKETPGSVASGTHSIRKPKHVILLCNGACCVLLFNGACCVLLCNGTCCVLLCNGACRVTV